MERRGNRWRSWIWCSDLDCRSAWIPEQILSLDFNNRAILKTDYDSAELTVEIGETVIGIGFQTGGSGAGTMWVKRAGYLKITSNNIWNDRSNEDLGQMQATKKRIERKIFNPRSH